MSYRKIFSVVNEHTASTVTARYAISLAATCKAGLVLYAAHEESDSENIIRRIGLHLDHLTAVAFELDIPVTRITEIGNIGKMLPKRVQEEKADLVFYPLTPDERYGANLKRHTVHHLLRTIGSNLAIMRVITMAKPHPKNILVPLGKVASDGGSRLIFVTELAKSFHAKVTLFHLSAERETKGMPDDIIQFGKQLQQQHITVLERNGAGHISKAITVEAITHHNDLIVLGASGRGILRRVFIGNPAGEVIHQPPCNTILFRPAL
ncbi:MAG: universal stress protein [Deltaproteobacteria bacterium]|nr:universal stress protein [Deltaproteobacteria bacterium]